MTITDIPKGIIRVDNPDHPFTYDGPDTLLSDKNGLLAIFSIRDNEYINANKLLSRLINSLIAYPANTQMILLANSEMNIPSSINQSGDLYFEKFIEPKDIKKSKSLINDGKSQSKLKEIKDVQRKLFNLQSQIQKDNIEYIHRKKKFDSKITPQNSPLKEKAKYYDRTKQKEVSVKANIFKYQNQFYGQKKLSNNTSDIIELQPYFEFVINSEFNVDNGIPYFKHLSRKVLNVDEVPTMRFDPLKPTRVASLFGWHLVNTNEFSELSSRISKYKR